MMSGRGLTKLLSEIRACRMCEAHIEPRPILRVSPTAKLCLVGQAPGVRVHQSGVPWTDPSGERLRDWLGLDRATFYDERHIAIVPMGFCFPGLDAKGGDRPPRRECAAHWREPLFQVLPDFKLTILIGGYAQKWHLGAQNGETLTQTVKAWRNYAPRYIPLPHPSWRNNAWLKKNPWFERDLLPYLRGRVRRLLSS
jgi:uracil-DNA glycosylase